MPITALYAGLLALMFLGLSGRVSKLRRRDKVGIGHGESRDLHRAIRVHGNFAEYVPLTLVLMGLVEANGAPGWAVHALGAATLVGRLMHAWGLGKTVKASFGRFWGLALHWGAIAAAAGLGIWQGVAAL